MMKIYQFLFLLSMCYLGLCHPRPEYKGYQEKPLENDKQQYHMSDRFMHPSLEDDDAILLKAGRIQKPRINDKELENDYWLENGKKFVEQQFKKRINEGTAKNIIFFLGDGMGVPTISATRVYIGGEELNLFFDEFPYVALSKTYCVDKQVADSACTSTAYLTGVKANDATTGLNAQVAHNSCNATKDVKSHTESIASWAMKAGKDAGFVTTTRVTHASPQGLYAHNANRDWENDMEIRKSGCDPNEVDDVTEQLVNGEVGKKLKVIFGCGRREFLPIDAKDEDGKPGLREDNTNLINKWLSSRENPVYVTNKTDLLNLDPKSNSHYLGLFDSSHCTYSLEVQRDKLEDVKPSLTDMTAKAIEILSQNDKGFFLFVEGGRIDLAHHDNFAKIALEETVQFSNAIKKATEMTNEDDTLIIVTADHSHAFTMNGYPNRGNDIFGFGGLGDDGLPFTTLSYANGMGYYKHVKKDGGRVDISTLDMTPIDFQFPGTTPRDLETHGGEDVGIFARGPWAHLFSGTIEQNLIPHILAYAGCIGNGMTHCDNH